MKNYPLLAFLILQTEHGRDYNLLKVMFFYKQLCFHYIEIVGK